MGIFHRGTIEMIRVTIIETDEGVLYTTEPFELPRCTIRIVSFDTSHNALEELQGRRDISDYLEKKKVSVIKTNLPSPPGQLLTHETYDGLKRILMGHCDNAEGRFIREELLQEGGAKIPLQFVHDAYCLFTEKNRLRTLPIKKFGKVLRDSFGLTTKQTSYKGKNVTCLLNYNIK